MTISSVEATSPAERARRQIVVVVSLCFFSSGTAGLIYEVLWTRMFGLVFGHTVFAITTVLSAFMAGLGLGSYLFGRVADRESHPLRLYGLLEVGIGLYAFLTPSLLSMAEVFYIQLHRSLKLSFIVFSLSQFLLLFLILLVPTTLMGATLPVLSRFFAHKMNEVGSEVGRLYALNTFGAVLGAYAAGFHLIPALGIRKTLYLAAIANVAIGVLAVVCDRRLHQLGGQRFISSAPPAARRLPNLDLLPNPRSGGSHWTAAIWLTIVGLGLSGAASMMYQVAWTRTLALVIGSSTYAFSTMLVTFLAGLAIGSWLFSRLAGRLRVDPFFFACLQFGIGVSALLVTFYFDRLPELFFWAFRLSQSSGFVKVLQFTLSALAMFLPTLFMGATFPCVVQIASKAINRVGSDVGTIYFINTAGAIAGTLLAGFLLIPAFGLQATLKLAVVLNLSLALAIFLASGKNAWARRLAACGPLLALAVLFVSPPWEQRVMSSGVAIYGKRYLDSLGTGAFREAAASTTRLLYYKDGISSTVTVHRSGADLSLRVNGKTDASNRVGDMHTQLMSGHLPLLLHPDPKRVLVIGLGSGVTAGAVALHPVEEIDLVEIEPAVVEAAGFFAKENREVLSDPRVRLAIADGRNFLLASERGYDVIISEPSNPWLRGIGNLFSVEFYELAARHLEPKGIICQWVQRYNLFPEDLKMVVKTFRSVFPHTTIWDTNPGDLLLIGSKEPLVLDYSDLQSKYRSLPGFRAELAGLGIESPLALLADFVLGEEETARYAQHARLNTDDHPLLEFSAPGSLYVDTVDLNRRIIRGFRGQEVPRIVGLPEDALRSSRVRQDLGLTYLAKGMPEEALVQFDEALRLDPRDVGYLVQRGRLHLRLKSVPKARADFEAALQIDPGNLEAHKALSQLDWTQQPSVPGRFWP